MRQTDLPPEPSVEIQADPARKTVTARMPRVSIPETTAETTAETPRAAGTGAPRQSGIMRKGAWFLGGLMIGALVVALVRGDLVQSARAWGAGALRTLKKVTTSAPAASPAPAMLAAAPQQPCAVDAEDPCDTLMAPFRDQVATVAVATPNVPTVRLEDLPKVRPPVVWIPRPKAVAPTAKEGEADSVVAEDEETATPAVAAAVPSPTTAAAPALTATPATEPSTQAANASIAY